MDEARLTVAGWIHVDPEICFTDPKRRAKKGIEKLITIYHASHYVAEIQPADRSFRPAQAVAVSAART